MEMEACHLINTLGLQELAPWAPVGCVWGGGLVSSFALCVLSFSSTVSDVSCAPPPPLSWNLARQRGRGRGAQGARDARV